MSKFCSKLVALLLLLLFTSFPVTAQIIVNEVVASNDNTFEDEDGDFPDWIELYNNSEASVNLSGYFISDDNEEPFTFSLPDFELAPEAYFIVFASDKDRSQAIADSLYPHANFKLSSDGETLILSNPDSVLVDEFSFPSLKSDESFGKAFGSDTTFYIFSEPTPMAQNATEGYLARLSAPVVTQEGGFFTRSTAVSLESSEHVHYTTDGTDPTIDSPLFGSEPMTFDQTTVLKLRTIQDGMLSSDIEVQTYFVNTSHQLPVVSLVTDPDYLFDENEGIYIHFEDDVEIPAHIEFYETNGNLGFKSHIGTKIYGAYSRNFDQKSLSVFFRGEYGLSELDYELFEEKDIDSFQSFILRNAGNDFGGAHMRDAAMSSIIEDVLDLDYQAYQPAVLYINGEYWGIQNIREKISEHFIASNRDVDTENIDLLEAGETPVAAHGSIDEWMVFWEALENADVTVQAEYDSVVSHIDIENFIDYWATEVFYANTDWPAINVKFWKERSPEGKWRWIIYDLDHGFNLYSGEGDYNLDMMEHTLQTNPDLLKYGNPLWSTYQFRKLLENDGFKARFVTRLSGLMNTAFETDRMIAVIDSISSIIAPEMPAHEDRWELVNWWSGEGPFEAQVEDMRSWARTRHSYMFQHMQNWLGLSDLSSLSVDISNQEYGSVVVNRAELENYPWSGQYFEDYQIPVTAVPNDGYLFTGWSGDITSEDSSIYVDPGASVTANFAPATGVTSTVVINEIMYNPPESPDTEDWVELYNTTGAAIDLSGWILKDEEDDHAFTIPQGTEIDAESFLVISRDLDAFNETYSNVDPLLGNMDFGLAGGDDQVRLFDDSEVLIDIVSYDDESPWPAGADGTGSTLELINPGLDNGAASSWKASETNLGTPGKPNSVLTSNERIDELIPTSTQLLQNYPNPFNPVTTISFDLPVQSRIKLTVYDMLGREVSVLDQGIRSAGTHSVSWDASNQASGMYLYHLEIGDEVHVKKMLLIK